MDSVTVSADFIFHTERIIKTVLTRARELVFISAIHQRAHNDDVIRSTSPVGNTPHWVLDP